MELDIPPVTRQYYATIDDALREFDLPAENLPMVHEILARLDVGRVYIPTRSRTYIAIEGPDGPPNIAWINPGFVDVRMPDGTIASIDLPTVAEGRSRAGTKADQGPDERVACPTCFMILPASGVCGTCD